MQCCYRVLNVGTRCCWRVTGAVWVKACVSGVELQYVTTLCILPKSYTITKNERLILPYVFVTACAKPRFIHL
uniref:Uncharacterized protein n=1 Tax=Anguilla anguilla TaxID=7936 RepID=A0A0E9WVW8_ANGAN